MSERSGLTVTSSVSISQEYVELIKKYKLSPTEIFRKGMGVALYDLGVPGYSSILLRNRSLIAKKFMKEYYKNEQLQQISILLEELNKKIITAKQYEKQEQDGV